MEYSEEVRKLAETLKNTGLAVSMLDALEKAQSIIGKKEIKKEEFAVPSSLSRAQTFEKAIDTTQTTLDEVKKPEERLVEESAEAEEQLKKEEVFVNKTDVEQKKEDTNQKKVDYSAEKKIDLSKIFDVNK